jgi:hypothetical protein
MAPVWPRTIFSVRFFVLCASLKARIIAAPIGSKSTLCTTMSAACTFDQAASAAASTMVFISCR